MAFCTNCGHELEQGARFCVQCGTPAGQVARPVKRSLLIRRASQFVCATNTYDVIVDGISYGNIAAGKSMPVDVHTDVATVTVKSTTILIWGKRTVRVKMGNHPILTYSLQWPGNLITFSCQDAVLEG